MDYATFSDIIRTGVLLIGFTLASMCVKFTYLALRNGEGYRAWGLASYALIIITPAIYSLYRYDRPLLLPAVATYFGGLLCGIVAMRKTYTMTPEWRRLRRANRRRVTGRRAEEDALRAEDRVLQAEERAASRHAEDAERPMSAEVGEVRDAQDANREHSHGLQDADRAEVRRVEDARRDVDEP